MHLANRRSRQHLTRQRIDEGHELVMNSGGVRRAAHREQLQTRHLHGVDEAVCHLQRCALITNMSTGYCERAKVGDRRLNRSVECAFR